MSGSVVLLHLAGAIALLLWATRMVSTGVERAYGDVLRHRLRATMRNPFMAVLTGCALSIALQSSTAVTLLVGSFAGAGIVSGMSGQLAVRGAEIGSALVVKLLSFDLSLLVPICLATGTMMFMATERRSWRQFGRILVGIGLLILSLEMIGEASEPLRESRLLPVDRRLFLDRPGDRLPACGVHHLAFPFQHRRRAAARHAGRPRLHPAGTRRRAGAWRQSRQLGHRAAA